MSTNLIKSSFTTFILLIRSLSYHRCRGTNNTRHKTARIEMVRPLIRMDEAFIKSFRGNTTWQKIKRKTKTKVRRSGKKKSTGGKVKQN